MIGWVAAHRRRLHGEPGERGYVLVMVAVMLTLMVALVGFSIDMGSWYRRGSKLQNAVDSAALAGVMYLPGDFSSAGTAATELLARNGVSNGVDNVTVSVNQVVGNPRRLRVCATDGRASAMFARVVEATARIRRCATAEYVLPVAMGSPLNVFDQTNLGVWPAVNGFCTATEEGDYVLSKYRANKPPPGTTTGCPGTTGELNPLYRASGYSYIVELRSTSAVAIELYDATFNMDAGSPDKSPEPATAAITTRFNVINMKNTPLDETDDVIVSTTTVNSNDASWKAQWRTLYTTPGSEPADTVYRVQASTLADEANSVGSNSFGIRARTGASFSRCTTISGDAGYSATCPQVYAKDALSVYADAGSMSPATFYLASIPTDFAGKTMVVSLFDPGEGASTIEILDPNGNPVTFGWTTKDDFTVASGTTNRLDVSGLASPRLTNRNGASKFNERMLELQMALPSNYATLFGTKTWWRIRYSSSASVTDRTTWSVTITGEPVRLVPDS